jgi:tetratricopeptide (TPR) repeat protein
VIGAIIVNIIFQSFFENNAIMKNLLITIVLLLSLKGTAAEKDSAEYYFQKALLEKTSSHHLLAFQLLQKALQFDGNNMQIMTEYGNVAMELRKYEVAKDAFLKVHQNDNKNTQAIENLAHIFFYLRKFDDAIQYARIMLKDGIGNDADFIIGKSEYENENYYDAVKYLEAYFKRNTNRADIAYAMARSYVEMSNYKTATAWFEKSVALQPDNNRWIYEMALVYYAIPDDRNAIRCFELAAEKGFKKDNDYYENLGNAYMNTRQVDKGIECYNVVLQHKPNDPELLYVVADSYYRAGRYNEAIQYWDKILQNDQKNARSLYMIGMSYQKKGEKDKGQQICDAAIVMDPSLAMFRQQKQLNPGL